jgi:apolipoprotein N-acyltransferase
LHGIHARHPWLVTLLLGLAGGALHALAHAGEGWWPGLWLAPVAVMGIGLGASRRQALMGAVVLGGVGALGLAGAAWEPVLVAALVIYRVLVLLAALLLLHAERDTLPPLALTLVYPTVVTAAEFGMAFTPLGTSLSDGYVVADATVVMQLAAVTGVFGLTFLAAWTGSVLGLLMWRPHGRAWRGPAVAAVIALALVLGGGWRHLQTTPREALSVAAVHAPMPRGGTARSLAENRERLAAYGPLVLEAAARGAGVVVWPELILSLQDTWTETVEAELAQLARASGAWQVIGLHDRDGLRNIARVIDPSGQVRAEYQKTHLVVARETSHAGSAPAPVVALGPAGLGVLICNDDVFTDVARQLGRDGARVVADPTWDWPDVAAAHARITRVRAVENATAYVRAARGGVSQLIGPRGRVLASHSVLDEPRQVLVGTVPLGDGGTLYARVGDVFAWMVVTLLAGLVVGAIRRRRA